MGLDMSHINVKTEKKDLHKNSSLKQQLNVCTWTASCLQQHHRDGHPHPKMKQEETGWNGVQTSQNWCHLMACCWAWTHLGTQPCCANLIMIWKISLQYNARDMFKSAKTNNQLFLSQAIVILTHLLSK